MRGPRGNLLEGTSPGEGVSAESPRGGFSLVEVMVATLVVGVGVVAAVHGMATSVVVSDEGRNVLVTGVLAENIRELCDSLDFSDPQGGGGFGPEAGESGIEEFDDIDDLNGLVLSPPIGADRNPLPSYAGWSQSIAVHSLDPQTFAVLEPPGGSPFLRVDVEILKGSRSLGTYEWIITRWGE